MLFNSYIFILFFFPLCILGFFYLNAHNKNNLAQIFLLGMSLWFYGYFNIKYLPIIICSILINYGTFLLLDYLQKQGIRKSILVMSILFNTGILFYFKYYDFFTENINFLFHTDFTLQRLILPLGISFFSFQQLSFIIDAYRCEVPKYSFLDYAVYVTYFPQLIAGPIVTHDELIPQFADKSRRQINWDNMAKGLYIFVLGLSKKVLIADTFGNAANWGFSNINSLDSISAFVTMLSYTIQIYFDFSGYCDMAIGIGRIMNIELPVNFNSPYKALTIAEFWQRWHITLTRFFTRYLYIPLGGNRTGKIRTYLNTFIVFLASGLWHGANWTFILWGGVHGLYLIIYKYKKQFFEQLHPALNWIMTFGFVNITWVLFRSDSVRDAGRILYCIAKLEFHGINKNLVQCFNLVELKFLFNKILGVNILSKYSFFFLVAFFTMAILGILGCSNAYERMEHFSPTIKNSILIVTLLIWSVFSFSGISTFLYFNF